MGGLNQTTPNYVGYTLTTDNTTHTGLFSPDPMRVPGFQPIPHLGDNMKTLCPSHQVVVQATPQVTAPSCCALQMSFIYIVVALHGVSFHPVVHTLRPPPPDPLMLSHNIAAQTEHTLSGVSGFISPCSSMCHLLICVVIGVISLCYSVSHWMICVVVVLFSCVTTVIHLFSPLVYSCHSRPYNILYSRIHHNSLCM